MSFVDNILEAEKPLATGLPGIWYVVPSNADMNRLLNAQSDVEGMDEPLDEDTNTLSIPPAMAALLDVLFAVFFCDEEGVHPVPTQDDYERLGMVRCMQYIRRSTELLASFTHGFGDSAGGQPSS